MKRITLLFILSVLILPFTGLANDINTTENTEPDDKSEDISQLPANCPPITEEQIKHLEESMCGSEVVADPWIDGEAIDTTEEDPEDKPTEGGGGQKGKGFFGGVGGLSVAVDQGKDDYIYSKSRLNIKKDKKKRIGRRRNQNFLDAQNENELSNGSESDVNNDLNTKPSHEQISKISTAIFNLNTFLNSAEGSNSQIFDGIQNGDYKESLVIENITPMALIFGSAAILYKVVRFINVPGYLFLTASAGAYADFDSEYKDYPERILDVENKEKLDWLLSIDEIRMNALLILKYTKDRVCENYPLELSEEIAIESPEGPKQNYCQSVSLILE